MEAHNQDIARAHMVLGVAVITWHIDNFAYVVVFVDRDHGHETIRAGGVAADIAKRQDAAESHDLFRAEVAFVVCDATA